MQWRVQELTLDLGRNSKSVLCREYTYTTSLLLCRSFLRCRVLLRLAGLVYRQPYSPDFRHRISKNYSFGETYIYHHRPSSYHHHTVQLGRQQRPWTRRERVKNKTFPTVSAILDVATCVARQYCVRGLTLAFFNHPNILIQSSRPRPRSSVVV